MKRFWLLALFMAGSLTVALSAPAFADENGATAQDALEDVNSAIGGLSSRVSAVEKTQSLEIQIHGFAELDSIFDTETTGKQEYISNVALPRQGTLAGQSNQTQQSMRNSRFDFLAQTKVDGWLTKGYIEGDFLGASNTAEANLYVAPTFRIRHAYLDAQKDGWDFMAGQYWTLYGWNMDYVLASVQPQPIMGTFYERTPRVSVMKTMGDDAQVQIAVDAERPEQSESAYPNFNGGIRFLLNDWKGAFTYATGATKNVPLSVGISGTLRNYTNGATAANNWTNTDYVGKGVAVDVMIPILPASDKDDISMVISGECSASKGAADELNGFTGGISGTPGTYALDAGIAGMASGVFALIDTQSVNGQLQFHFPKSWGTLFTVGYGEVFSDNIGDFTATASGVYNDDYNLFANIMQDVTPEVRLAVEFDDANTHYLSNVAKQTQIAVDNRVIVSTWYRF